MANRVDRVDNNAEPTLDNTHTPSEDQLRICTRTPDLSLQQTPRHVPRQYIARSQTRPQHDLSEEDRDNPSVRRQQQPYNTPLQSRTERHHPYQTPAPSQRRRAISLTVTPQSTLSLPPISPSHLLPISPPSLPSLASITPSSLPPLVIRTPASESDGSGGVGVGTRSSASTSRAPIPPSLPSILFTHSPAPTPQRQAARSPTPQHTRGPSALAPALPIEQSSSQGQGRDHDARSNTRQQLMSPRRYAGRPGKDRPASPRPPRELSPPVRGLRSAFSKPPTYPSPAASSSEHGLSSPGPWYGLPSQQGKAQASQTLGLGPGQHAHTQQTQQTQQMRPAQAEMSSSPSSVNSPLQVFSQAGQSYRIATPRLSTPMDTPGPLWHAAVMVSPVARTINVETLMSFAQQPTPQLDFTLAIYEARSAMPIPQLNLAPNVALTLFTILEHTTKALERMYPLWFASVGRDAGAGHGAVDDNSLRGMPVMPPKMAIDNDVSWLWTLLMVLVRQVGVLDAVAGEALAFQSNSSIGAESPPRRSEDGTEGYEQHHQYDEGGDCPSVPRGIHRSRHVLHYMERRWYNLPSVKNNAAVALSSATVVARFLGPPPQLVVERGYSVHGVKPPLGSTTTPTPPSSPPSQKEALAAAPPLFTSSDEVHSEATHSSREDVRGRAAEQQPSLAVAPPSPPLPSPVSLQPGQPHPYRPEGLSAMGPTPPPTARTASDALLVLGECLNALGIPGIAAMAGTWRRAALAMRKMGREC